MGKMPGKREKRAPTDDRCVAFEITRRQARSDAIQRGRTWLAPMDGLAGKLEIEAPRARTRLRRR